tara:strand:- start:10335 stop:12089 length:1755 start_codon:yes stop_codon:yes gene_type:complete
MIMSSVVCTGKPSEPLTWAALGLVTPPEEGDSVVPGTTGPGEPVDPEPTASSDGIASCFAEENAIFVSFDSGADSQSGAEQSEPVQTISHALSLSQSGDTICIQSRSGNAAYDETGATLDVPSGVSLVGGFDSSWNHTSTRTPISGHHIAVRYVNLNGDAELNTLEISAASPGTPSQDSMGLRLVHGTAKLTIIDSEIRAGDISIEASEDESAGSSYGVYAYQLANLEIQDSEIRGGRGGDGGKGADGEQGEDGDPGDPGGAIESCSAKGDGGAGGAGGEHPTIPELNGFSGGAGGNGPPGFGNATDGNAGDGPCGGSGTAKRDGPHTAEDATCNGDDGSPGAPYLTLASGPGSMSDFYQPLSGGDGDDGNHGDPGSGGGGGGAHTCFTCEDTPGNGGGGGGAAGSGGEGGKGGQGGGGSFALYANNTSVSLTNVTLISEPGGSGGNAGTGGPGGSGGDGGNGPDTCPFRGGGGGAGGKGGDGGPGGDGSGGSGGPSIALVIVDSPVSLDTVQLQSGPGGPGGDARHGRSGDGGHSYAIFASEVSLVPDLSSSVLAVGTPGNAGSVTGSGPVGNDGATGNQYIP